MKKIVKFFVAVLAVVLVSVATSCGKKTGPLTIWVGTESVKFYQEKADAWLAETGNTFKIEVKGTDTGGAAATYLADTAAGADIFTVAHDNLGKLLAGSGTIAAVTDQNLVKQMETQNSDAFLDVCYLAPGDGGSQQYYAVPYIAQALVYYYDTRLVSAEQVTSFESLLEVAKAKGKTAFAVTGTDAYNFSLFLLAQPYNEAAKAAFPKSTLALYEGGVQTNCNGTGDDIVACMKYAQRLIADKNGRNGTVVSSDGYVSEITNGTTLGFISGAWKYTEAVAAWGEENVGIAELPTFTLTAADEYGKAKAGMTFKAGTFADCKVFVKKKASPYAKHLDSLLAFLTSDAVQFESYEKCQNLPASSTVTGVDNPLAAAQIAMFKYGIAQPFGFKAKYNQYYYSSGTDARFVALIQNKDGSFDDAKILKELQTITYVWVKGKDPENDAALSEFVKGIYVK